MNSPIVASLSSTTAYQSSYGPLFQSCRIDKMGFCFLHFDTEKRFLSGTACSDTFELPPLVKVFASRTSRNTNSQAEEAVYCWSVSFFNFLYVEICWMTFLTRKKQELRNNVERVPSGDD